MTGRILIVEDSATQREKLRIILEAEGFEVMAASDGAEGLKFAGESPFDLVISDIMMPGFSGYELCCQLKKEGPNKDVPVILLTTLSDPMDVIQGLECGADNFIIKPYEPEVLVQRVQNVLENWRLRAQGKLNLGNEIFFLGRKFTITSEKQQILNLLISTFEDTVRTSLLLHKSQRELMEAKEKIERYAKMLEGKVELSEEKYRLLLEHAHDAIVVLGLKGKVLEANWQAGRLFGLVRSEIEETDFFNLLPKGQREKAKEGFRRLVEDKTPFVQEYNLADFQEGYYVECSISLVDMGEKLAVAIFRNMTERKKTEQDLRKYSEELERSNEELREFTFAASQDLQEPFRKIQTFAYMLTNDSRDHLVETLRDQLDPVSKSLERMRLLISKLSNPSRAVTGNKDIVTSPPQGGNVAVMSQPEKAEKK